MVKLFTLDEATRLLPLVEAHVDALQTSARDADTLRRTTLKARTDGVEARNLLQEIAFVVGVAHDAKAELDRLGVEVTDLEHGQVAFPSQMGGEFVTLTWRRGDPGITHYRRVTGGDPLPVDGRSAPPAR